MGSYCFCFYQCLASSRPWDLASLKKSINRVCNLVESMLKVPVTHTVHLLKTHQLNSRFPDDVRFSCLEQVFEYDLATFLLLLFFSILRLESDQYLFPSGGGEAGFVFSCLLNQASGLRQANTLAIFSFSLFLFLCCFITFHSPEGPKKNERQRKVVPTRDRRRPCRRCEVTKTRFISLFEGRKRI